MHVTCSEGKWWCVFFLFSFFSIKEIHFNGFKPCSFKIVFRLWEYPLKSSRHTRSGRHTPLTCCCLCVGAEGWSSQGAVRDGIWAYFWYFGRRAVIIRTAFSCDLFPVIVPKAKTQQKCAFFLPPCFRWLVRVLESVNNHDLTLVWADARTSGYTWGHTWQTDVFTHLKPQPVWRNLVIKESFAPRV